MLLAGILLVGNENLSELSFLNIKVSLKAYIK